MFQAFICRVSAHLWLTLTLPFSCSGVVERAHTTLCIYGLSDGLNANAGVCLVKFCTAANVIRTASHQSSRALPTAKQVVPDSISTYSPFLIVSSSTLLLRAIFSTMPHLPKVVHRRRASLTTSASIPVDPLYLTQRYCSVRACLLMFMFGASRQPRLFHGRNPPRGGHQGRRDSLGPGARQQYVSPKTREIAQNTRNLADQRILCKVLTHIISQLRPGADLSRVTLPTFILEPRSMLERITKCVPQRQTLYNLSGG